MRNEGDGEGEGEGEGEGGSVGLILIAKATRFRSINTQQQLYTLLFA